MAAPVTLGRYTCRPLRLDARSLRDAYGGARVNRPGFEHMPGYLVEGSRDQRPETTDLVDARPDVVTRLGGELIRWLENTDAPLAPLREGSPRST